MDTDDVSLFNEEGIDTKGRENVICSLMKCGNTLRATRTRHGAPAKWKINENYHVYVSLRHSIANLTVFRKPF